MLGGCPCLANRCYVTFNNFFALLIFFNLRELYYQQVSNLARIRPFVVRRSPFWELQSFFRDRFGKQLVVTFSTFFFLSDFPYPPGFYLSTNVQHWRCYRLLWHCKGATCWDSFGLRDIRIKFFAEKGLTPNSHDFLGPLWDPIGHGLGPSWYGGVLAEKGELQSFFRDRLEIKQRVPSIHFSSFLPYNPSRGTNFSPRLKSQKESHGHGLGGSSQWRSTVITIHI